MNVLTPVGSRGKVLWRRARFAAVGAALLAYAAVGCAGQGLSVGGLVASGSSIAVVDTQWLLRESKMGRRVNDTLDQFMNDRQVLVELEQTELRNLEGELVRLDGILSPDAKRQKEDQLRRRVAGYQQKVEDMNREFQTKRVELLGEFRQQVDAVVRQIAQQRGTMLVVEKGDNTPTRYSEQSLDVSPDVLEALDQRFVQLDQP